MTIQHHKAMEHPANKARPFLQLHECRKRPMLLEPVKESERLSKGELANQEELITNVAPEYVYELIERFENGDEKGCLEAANELSRVFDIRPDDPLTMYRLADKAMEWWLNAMKTHPAAEETKEERLERLRQAKASYNATVVQGNSPWNKDHPELWFVRRIRGSIPARATCQVSDRAQVRDSGRCGNRRIFS